jgi:hypothetical protein
MNPSIMADVFVLSNDRVPDLKLFITYAGKPVYF